MSAHGQFHSPGASDWVEQLRNAMKQESPPVDEAVLEAAYDASDIDTATMFAYFEGRLTEEERREVEAEVAASAHALNKLSRVGAIVAQSRGGARAAAGRSAAPLAKAHSPARKLFTSDRPAPSESSASETQRVVHRVNLPQPHPSIGVNTLPRAEDCLRPSSDSPCEFYRSLEKNRDQLRIFHLSAPVGTLVGVRILEPAASAESPSVPPTQFAVLRSCSESTTTTTLTVPQSFHRGEVLLELVEIPLAELTAEDVDNLLNSWERAAGEDPVAVTPLHDPRSAWQVWADEVLKTPADRVDPAVREVAELIAAS